MGGNTDEQVLYIEDYQYLIQNGGGRNIKAICPFCHDIRSDKRDKALSINTAKLAYHCHYCGAHGYFKSRMDEVLKPTNLYKRNFMPQKKTYIRPTKKESDVRKDFSDSFLGYFKERGISEATLKEARITQEAGFIPKYKKKMGCIAFNFYLDDELINVKHRTRDKSFALTTNAQLIPYNINSISPDKYQEGEEKYAIITEGEIDCISYIECGYKHVVSMPNGANVNMEWLDDFIDSHFDKLDVIYVSTDSDKKGVEARDELIRRFGKEKCRVIGYPDDCKDINEVLVKHGRESVKSCFENYTELTMEGVMGLYDVENSLDALFRDGMQKGATVGIPSVDNILSFQTGMLNVVTGVPTHGKALALDTPLPTPAGWTTMGDVEVGDELYDESGKICKVTFVTPIQYNRECYKVIFSDNSEIVCDRDHLWVTRDDKARRSEYRYRKRIEKNGTTEIQSRGSDQSFKRTYPQERTTKEILDTLYVDKGKRANHAVRLQKALQGIPTFLPLHPYVLGVWLVDGTSCQAAITTGDVEVVDRITRLGYKVTKREYKYSYGILNILDSLRDLSVLGNKHIPQNYLRCPYEDRLELLKGLMDSDGTCYKDGTCSYSTSIKCLADDFYELIMSMGVKATITSSVGKINGVPKKTNYSINFRPNFKCFTLKRKNERIKSKYADEVNWRYIRKVEKVESVPVKCIQVDSANHLYLCGRSMIPTHNTYLLNYLLIRLNILQNWKAAFFSPEFYPVTLHISQIMETLGGQRFEQKNYSQQIYEKMKEYVADNFFWIDPDDTDITSVLDRARYLIKKKGIKSLVIDPFNALTDKEKRSVKQDEYISEFLQKLRWFARKYNVAVFLVMHPTKMTKLENGLYPVCDLYNCKGASEIYDKADIGLTVWRNEMENYAELHVTKIKFRHLGSKGHATFKFNLTNARYVEIEDVEDLKRSGHDVKNLDVTWDYSNFILNKMQARQTEITLQESPAAPTPPCPPDMPFAPPTDDAPF